MSMEALPYPFATSNTDLLSPASSSAESIKGNVCTALVLKDHTLVPLIGFYSLLQPELLHTVTERTIKKHPTFLQIGVSILIQKKLFQKLVLG